MSEQNKAISRRFVDEIIVRKNLAAFDDLVAPDVVAHHVPPPLQQDFDGWKAVVSMVLGAFPDAKITVGDMIAEGDKVVLRWSVQGTHKGELMGIPATGKKVAFTGMIIDRFAAGKIVEHWEQFDMLGMMQQLGVVPPPE